MVFGQNVVEIVIRAKDRFSSSINNVNKSLDNFQKAALGAGLVAFGTMGAISLGNMAKSAAKFESVMFAVNRKTKDANKLLKKLQKATSGTVDKLSLMTSASTALQLGLEEEALPAMAEFASQVGPALGETAEFMFDSIVRGVGRASPLILDNLGLVIDTTKEYEKWATAHGTTSAQLDKSTKLQIIQNAVVEEATKRGMDLNGILDKAAGKQQAFATAIKDAKLAIGEELLPILQPLIEKLTFVINKFIELPGPVKQALAVISAVTVVVTVLTGAIILLTIAVGALDIALLPFIAVIVAVIAVISLIIIAILNWKKVVIGMYRVLQFGLAVWKIVHIAMKNVIIGIWNFIVDFIAKRVNNIIDKINWLIRQAQRIPGAKTLFPGLKELEHVTFNKLKGEIVDLSSKWTELMAEGNTRVKMVEAALTKEEQVTQELEKQKDVVTSISKEQATVNKLQGFKVLPTTGDIFNPKVFQRTEFESKFGYEQAKRGAGIEINIENISGLDPDEVAEALQRILDNKIST
jgi:hypothetical protein